MTDRQGDPEKQQEPNRQQQGRQPRHQQPPGQQGQQQPGRQGRQPPGQQPGQPMGQQGGQQPGQQQPGRQRQQPPGQPEGQQIPQSQQGYSQQGPSQVTPGPHPQQMGAGGQQGQPQGQPQPPGQGRSQSMGQPSQAGQPQPYSGQQMQPPQQTMPMGGGPGAAPPSMGEQQHQMQPAQIDDVIQTDVVTVQEDTPIATAVAKMESEDVGSVVVVDDDESPLSVLTDRKVALSIQEESDIAQQEAAELISGDLTTGEPEMNVYEAINQLSDEEIRRLPVVDEDGELVGIVTLDDLLVLLSRELSMAGDIIEEQSPRL